MQVEYPHLKKRDKPFPWTVSPPTPPCPTYLSAALTQPVPPSSQLRGGSDCDLFDYNCAKKEAEAKAALSE